MKLMSESMNECVRIFEDHALCDDYDGDLLL